MIEYGHYNVSQSSVPSGVNIFPKVCTVEVMKLNTAIGSYLHVALQHCLPYSTAGILIL